MVARTARTGSVSQQSWPCRSWPLGRVAGQHGLVAARAPARPRTCCSCRAPRAPSACCAQQPSPSIAIQYFCIAIQIFSLTQLPQSRYKNCIVTHCLPSLCLCNTIGLYCNTNQPTSIPFLLQHTFLLSCNTIPPTSH